MVSTSIRYRIELVITLPRGGEDIQAILAAYLDQDFQTDLEQIAWNLCDCDNDRLDSEFGRLEVVTGDVEQPPDGTLAIHTILRVDGWDE